MNTVKFAIVRPVPASYNRCVRTNVERINVALAKRQHAEYCKTLQKLGLELIWIEGDDTLPDSCFVEDTAVIFDEKAVICNMSIRSRASEVVEVAKVLEELKETYYIKPPAIIDGGDVLKIENRVFVGLFQRTNLEAIRQLRNILENSNFEIFPVKVHYLLHLKSACTYLGNDYVIVSKGHFDIDVLGDVRKIVVPRGEEYAADCLALKETVLMAKGYPQTKKLIEKEGFFVKELEISEFHKGEGALTCLSIMW
ncbi:MAG: arginine deiminase family protein [Candidatus Bathyarchaeota archaeon]|nr:arginine deiminase family protein [Candidatus Bathyarchaeota archaeon]MDH5532130.1 arginine deiminase family protein [Candidatus Bathyarchaeota archaeon]MDH5713491.1 arginine deiminase family protein [Candidatus Bathyarchaeota archaeon]